MEQTQVLNYMVKLSVMVLAMEEEHQAVIQGFTFFFPIQKVNRNMNIWCGDGYSKMGLTNNTQINSKMQRKLQKKK